MAVCAGAMLMGGKLVHAQIHLNSVEPRLLWLVEGPAGGACTR